MAWVTEYDLTWRSGTGPYPKNGYINIQRDGGSYQFPLKLRTGSLEISSEIPNLEDPVGRMSCSFTVVNDFTDFYTLIPLMTIENGEYKVVVVDTTKSEERVLFEGYINCEAVDQEMLNYADLTITASGLLNKLQYVHPDSVDTLQYMSIIDLVDDCLQLTGSAYDIWVSCGLYEADGGYAANTTFLNRTALFTELFWTNNIERMSALDILTAILKSFNCYLYWYGQTWYIEHYMYLHQNKAWISYTAGVSYGFSDTGTYHFGLLIPFDIFTSPVFKQEGNSQRLTVVPGLRELDIKLNHIQYFNMFPSDMSGLEVSGNEPVTLNIRRQWWGYAVTGCTYPPEEIGKSYNNIESAVWRSGYDITTHSMELNGLSVRFNVTASSDTILVIQWKFGIKGAYEIPFISGLYQDMILTFHWFLCTYDPTAGNRDYIVFTPDSSGSEEGTWALVEDGDPTTDFNQKRITVADLDQHLWTYTGEFKIPLGEVSGILDSSADIENLDLMFRMGTETVWKSGETATPMYHAHYGDFKATINEETPTNLLRGDITTDFLNKKTIELDIFDGGWNYKNAIFRYVNTYQYTPTEQWIHYGDSISFSLAKWLLQEKFRFYRVARQKISMNIIFIIDTFPDLALLTSFVDNNQSDKPFVLLSKTYYPEFNRMEIELLEYDDSEVVNLV